PLLVRPTPLDLPDINFNDASGATKSLTDWRGEGGVLNNLGPLGGARRGEKAALDKLEGELGGGGLRGGGGRIIKNERAEEEGGRRRSCRRRALRILRSIPTRRASCSPR